MYAGLLSFNVSLVLCIVTKLLSNTLCGINLGVDVHFLSFTSFKLILFLKFPIVFPYIALICLLVLMFINLYDAFPSLSPFFSASIAFCLLNLIYSFNLCDWLNSKTRCIFLVLILVSSKVTSFHNEAHTFLYQES